MSMSDLATNARTWFTEAIDGELGRRGKVKMVERKDVTGHVVMQFLSEAVPNAAGMSETELRQRLAKLAGDVMTHLIAGRTGEVLIVPKYWPPTFWMDHNHLQFDWHVGAWSPGEQQQRFAFPRI
ncbi:MAG: hypothetical protein AB7K09_00815 [Planctomycetota bacterium]